MSLNAAITQELPGLRAEAEGRMGAANGSSTGTLRRLTGRTEQDPDTHLESRVWETIHEDLPGRLRSSDSAGQYKTTTSAGVEVTVPVRLLHLPISTADVRDGDLYEVTAGAAIGLVYRLIESAPDDQLTALRIHVIAVPRPQEWGDPS